MRHLVDAESLGPVAVRGRVEPVEVFRLRSVARSTGRRQGDLALVGRDAELGQLRQAFERVIGDRAPVLVGVIGTAGAGKSRLTREFMTEIAGVAEVVRGRCLAYGDAITYWPLAEILRDVARTAPDAPAAAVVAALDRRLGADVPTRLKAIIGAILGATATSVDGDEIAWGVMRLMAMLAASAPIVVLIEDVHWADPALLALLETTRSWAGAVPILFLATARPELLESRPDWARTDERTARVSLDPLDERDVGDLLDEIPGGRAIAGSLRARLVEAAGGNPLYLEEFVAMLVDLGRLRLDDGSWVADEGLASLPVPSSISALLAARLDALDRAEQAVAERGSVIGRSFEAGALAALSPAAERGRLAGGLLGLLRHELIDPDTDASGGGEAYRFRHILIRDAAYDRLPKAERARLHEAFVGWLDGEGAGPHDEHVEIAAHHLAEAATYRWELAPRAAATAESARLAIDRLERAAGRAERLHAYAEVARYLGRAIILVDRVDGPARGLDLRRRRARNEYLAGDLDQAIVDARSAIEELGERGGRDEASLLGDLAMYLEAYGDREGGLSGGERALELAVGAGAVDVQLEVLNRRARFLMVANAAQEGLEDAERAVLLAGEQTADVERSNALSTLGVCLMKLGRRDEGIERLLEARAIAERAGDPVALIRASINLGVVYDSGPRREDLTDLYDAAIEEAERLGLSRFGIKALINAASAAFWAGHPTRSESLADRAVSHHVPSETTAFAWHVIAAARAAQGRFAAASEAAGMARALLDRLAVPPRELAYELVEADIATWQGRPSEAIRLVRAGLARDVQPDPDFAAGLYAVGIRAAIEAGRAGVARRFAADLRRSVASVPPEGHSWRGRAAIALAEAESSRAGPPAPDRWREAIVRIREADAPPYEAYAHWRLVEAMAAAGAPAGEVTAVANEALGIARRAEAEHLVERIAPYA